MTKISHIIKLLGENGYEELGTCLNDDMDNNYIVFEKDTPKGVITVNVSNNRVHQIFHDIKGHVELEVSYGYDMFILFLT